MNVPNDRQASYYNNFDDLEIMLPLLDTMLHTVLSVLIVLE